MSWVELAHVEWVEWNQPYNWVGSTQFIWVKSCVGVGVASGDSVSITIVNLHLTIHLNRLLLQTIYFHWDGEMRLLFSCGFAVQEIKSRLTFSLLPRATSADSSLTSLLLQLVQFPPKSISQHNLLPLSCKICHRSEGCRPAQSLPVALQGSTLTSNPRLRRFLFLFMVSSFGEDWGFRH